MFKDNKLNAGWVDNGSTQPEIRYPKLKIETLD